jgi:DNA-binding GntR family transcriptional regulator
MILQIPGRMFEDAGAGGMQQSSVGSIPAAPQAASSVKPPTVAEVVTDELRRRVVQGELPPGSHVREADIARALGVSVTPVRHALHRLADEGLVELNPHRGATVKELTLNDFLELAEVREALEAVAFRKAAPNITDEDLAQLRELHQAYHDACLRGDFQAALSADLAFHELVVQRSGNARLQELIRRLAILRLCLEAQNQTADTTRYLKDKDSHLPLLQALSMRDSAAAEEAIRQHTQEAVRDSSAAWRSGTEDEGGNA